MSEVITLKFVQDLLKDDHPDVTIQRFEGAPGSKRGDNYTSMVYRVSLHGVQKHLEPDGSCETEVPWEGSIIYKCLPESVIRREAFKSDVLFCNEVGFYTKIWPALQNFQKQWEDQVKTPFSAIPKCYLAQNDLVILKDLKTLGFIMPDRRQGLSMEQSYYVLKQLSHFHALSLAMKYHDPEGFFELINIQDGISEVFFVPENVEYYRNYYKEAIRNAIVMVEEELGGADDKEYMEKFLAFCDEDSFFQTMVDLVTPREPLAVIGHGDCWTNNFLFRYVNEDIAEMCIVDFQLVRYASPTLDLAYIIYLCLNKEQRVEHMPSLLEYYVDELHTRLLQMSEEESVFRGALNKECLLTLVKEEFRRSSKFGLGIALDMYPIMTCDSTEAPNLYQPKESEGASTSVKPVWTTNKACCAKMTDLIKELVDEGLL